MSPQKKAAARAVCINENLKARMQAGARAPLWLAVHEVGHAVAGLVVDEMAPCPGPFLRSITLRPTQHHLGG